jgi:hypothetical protein
MQPGDLMMLGEGAVLYSKEGTPELDLAYGELGEVVTVVRRSDHHTIVQVLHPTLGLRDIFAHQLHPMTGGESNEAR